MGIALIRSQWPARRAGRTANAHRRSDRVVRKAFITNSKVNTRREGKRFPMRKSQKGKASEPYTLGVEYW